MEPDPVRKSWCKVSSHKYDGFGQGRHGMSSAESINFGRAHRSYGILPPPADSQENVRDLYQLPALTSLPV